MVNEDKKVLMLPLDDDSSKTIVQAISNETARKILDFLADTPSSASEISEHLGIPLTTVKYNLDKLSEAGLIKVVEKRYSKKMRDIKIYAPQERLIVIIPGKRSKEDVLTILRRMVWMIGALVIVSGAIKYLTWAETPSLLRESVKAPTIPATHSLTAVSHTGAWFWFFLGGLFIILLSSLIMILSMKKRV
ncbi:MAG: ArsR family transcriptional regulator [Candidatus Syntrophoarchaeum sp. WYZ-LMO15]|nr:MAG: ArsR family transcriptional regulator [Candidatus Syntrophoarchaeum sp. WYZ-LMO15]